jgi:hypothetical protein
VLKIGGIMDNKLILWESLFAAYANYSEQVNLFLKEDGYADVVKSKLFSKERNLALKLISLLPTQGKELFLKELIHQGSFVHGSTEYCWKLISEMSHDYVAKNIEKEAEEMLSKYKEDRDVYEIYRCLLTLCQKLGYSELVQKIALRALSSPDNDVKEAGMDFIKRDAD